ncbi:hypothetical protein AVEN_112850-1 [Araneus ventricosus]|uniref:WDR36/Utp21 C-terminal domain-containing protein n=1 Tax=Araneus ventricosus TaxID=182803 RepID=A0A4Y2PLV9_ARAVE|nr:hypothetical protein AVEN_112850-1 [Araneus ventricosus]
MNRSEQRFCLCRRLSRTFENFRSGKTEKRLVEWFTVTPLCVSLTVSPSGEYLATFNVGSRGVCCLNVLLHQLPEAYDSLQLYIPMITMDGRYENNKVAGEAEADDSVPKFKSPEQISDELVTLSLVSKSHWLNLLDLDIIKRRNKPKEPVQVPKDAPFFCLLSLA